MMKLSLKTKIILFVVLLCLVAFPIGIAIAGGGGQVVEFSLVVEKSGDDPIEFTGASMGDNLRLESDLEGIVGVKLLTSGSLYLLTPAIKTATKIESHSVPDSGSSGWIDWVLEPARINPVGFSRKVGEVPNFSGTVNLGGVGAVFSDGNLASLRFTSSDEAIVYTYSGFDSDSDYSRSDFEIPSDYLVTD